MGENIMIDRWYLFIRPQSQGGFGLMKSLLEFSRNLAAHNGFVNISAIWSELEICCKERIPRATCSRKKWTSISICFMWWWKTGFLAMLLSQYNVGEGIKKLMLFRRYINHISSVVVDANARYSASAVEQDTVACFLAPQDNMLSPINSQHSYRMSITPGP